MSSNTSLVPWIAAVLRDPIELATVYDLPILFNGKDPAAVSVIKEDAPPAGSYAFAHKVELKEPLEVRPLVTLLCAS